MSWSMRLFLDQDRLDIGLKRKYEKVKAYC